MCPGDSDKEYDYGKLSSLGSYKVIQALEDLTHQVLSMPFGNVLLSHTLVWDHYVLKYKKMLFLN